jgi:hypothetical protein
MLRYPGEGGYNHTGIRNYSSATGQRAASSHERGTPLTSRLQCERIVMSSSQAATTTSASLVGAGEPAPPADSRQVTQELGVGGGAAPYNGHLASLFEHHVPHRGELVNAVLA